MEGRLKDIENFPKLNEEFFITRKSSLNTATGHNNQSIVSNGIQSTVMKMQRLTSMIQDMLRSDGQELNAFFQAEYTNMM
jgi:hypothetical protein